MHVFFTLILGQRFTLILAISIITDVLIITTTIQYIYYNYIYISCKLVNK